MAIFVAMYSPFASSCLTLLLQLLVLGAAAQVLSDDFSDGNFSSDPVWTGDTGAFVVNGDGRLQLNETEAAQRSLFTGFATTSLDNREWRCFVRQSFSGSANNNGRVYLSATAGISAFSDGESAGAMGYFLQFGESGSGDAIRLFRDDAVGESTTLIASGTEGQISGSFEYTLRVTRDGSGNWEIWGDPAAGSNYTLLATGTDATYTTSDRLGVACSFTVSNADNFFYDDFFFGDPAVDNTPPEWLSVNATSDATVSLTFNEPLAAAQAEDVTNYLLNGTTNPVSAVLTNPTVVVLTFSAAFPEGLEQSITVNGIADLAGNVLPESSDTFTWFVSGEAGVRDVVINEIMADPDPAIGLPVVEYVELFNAGAVFLDMADWVFVNTNTERVLDSAPLAPGGHLILCDANDAPALMPYGDVLAIESFTALANGGDSLTLRSPEGLVVDVVDYAPDWYNNSAVADGGTSLEQVNPFLNCSGESNWTASLSLSGGSPGEQNSVFNMIPDTQAPFLVSLFPSGDFTVVAGFNESLDPSVIGSLQVTVSPGLTVNQLEFQDDELWIEVDMPLEQSIEYTVTITGAADCEGNTSGDLSDVFELGYPPQPGDVRITEIMADPDDDLPSPNAEFIEVENRTAFTLDISSLMVNSGFFEDPLLMAPGERLILCDEGDFDAFIAYPTARAMVDFPGLTNSGAELTLSENAQEIDRVLYNLDWYGDEDRDDGGYSLELINPFDPCSDGTNWRACQDETGATPGLLNSVHDETPDTAPPVLDRVFVESQQLLGLSFLEPIGAALPAIDAWEVFVAGTDEPAGFAVSSVSVSPLDESNLAVQFDAPIPAGSIYELHTPALEDCWGNAAAVNARFGWPEPFVLGDLVINEVLFNPYTGGTDFVEVLNRSPRTLSINGFALGNASDGGVSDTKIITDRGVVLFPGEVLALTTSLEDQTAFYPSASSGNLLRVPSMPAYNNSDGTVYLLDALLQVADAFTYSEDDHFALLDDLNGVSLERVLADGDSEASNFHSAAESVGFATPGEHNSQSVAGIFTAGTVSVSPELFSPDNDGFEDVAVFSYELDRAGWVGTATIYDHEGREISRLLNNELLGTSGTFTWDGTRQDRQKARMGAYVLIFELFETGGDKQVEKRIVTLGHRL